VIIVIRDAGGQVHDAFTPAAEHKIVSRLCRRAWAVLGKGTVEVYRAEGDTTPVRVTPLSAWGAK
jgi:hypothetical protein